ncbi:2OG-Fe(II) oxygenase [Erythrobacter sp. EC-HK427]|uniref:2OG-Fe(II) oxygenase n=1 Tax=Erythrobacter sp. EC-HK427 TaxID=2038396 RepID=UPI0012543102|nr:2OG-Fe(II) oxygenase [Erythrobacter sp. EC-HK427]VVS97045.1 conserved hypothetical protein [Erythrobacter sp. EC-HK427]
MHESARIQYDMLARIGDAGINAALIAQLDAKLADTAPNTDQRQMRANLLRRSGDIDATRDAYRTLVPGAMEAHPQLTIPPGLTSKDGQRIAPLIVIDDLLPAAAMEALYRHACDIADRFRHARLSSGENLYDPDKRETLLTWEFEVLRQHFLDYVADNLYGFQDALELPRFTVERSEIKLTNHLEGGFFNTHRDNHGSGREAGRALTWLYYFSATPPRFAGGELFILDSDPANAGCSDSFFTKVEPRANRFVAFPSWFYHAVGPTHVPGNAFADGRFAVSGHLHKPADTLDWPW